LPILRDCLDKNKDGKFCIKDFEAQIPVAKGQMFEKGEENNGQTFIVSQQEFDMIKEEKFN